MTAIYFDARIDGAQLQKDVAQINKYLAQITNTVKKEGDEIDGLSKRMGASLTSALTLVGAGAFVKDIARVRGEFQQLEVAFETMLGNKELADKLMAQVVDFAAKTPFQLQDVATGAKQLLAYGTAADDILPTLKALGDVSAGLSVPIERLILNYGQVRTQMKMTGRELRDFNGAGVPIIAELSKNLGVAEDKIADMVERGQIGFKDVEKAFITMTSQGGRFNDLMDKQAKTITGLSSNFADAWNRMLNSIGQQNEGIITDVIKGATEVVDNYEEVLNVLKILVATYGTYKAAVIATGIATRISATYGVFDVATKKLQVAQTLKAAFAQNALNTAMKANPYILIASAVAGLVSLLTIYAKRGEESAKVSAEFTKNLNEEQKAIKKDFEAIKNAKDGTEDRARAIQAVNDKYKEYLPNLLTEADNLSKVESAQKAVVSAMAKSLAFKAQENDLLDVKTNVDDQFKDFYKEVDQASKKLNDTQKGQFKGLIEGYKNELKSQFDSLGYFPEFTNLKINEIFKSISGNNLGSFALKDIDDAIKSLIRSEVELDEKTKGLSVTYESYLKALGIGEAAPEPTVLKTINERIAETSRLLADAKARLIELRQSGSTANDQDIIDQDAKIKEYEERLVLLTGVSKKVTESLLKEEKERYEGEVDFAQQEIELRRSVEASRIAIMQNGTEKQIKEAEAVYQNELDLIKKQEDEWLKAYNAKNGLKPGDSGYNNDLPVEAFEIFDTLRINAEIEKNLKIKAINKENADSIKAIWEQANDVFLTDTEKTINQINKFYENLIEEAKKLGETDFTKINKAREEAIKQANVDAQIEMLNFEEEIAIDRAELSTQGFNKEIELEKKKLVIVRDIAQKKLNLLKATNEKLYANDIQLLQDVIDASNQGITKTGVTKLSEKANQYKSELELILQINEALMEQFGVNKANARIINDLLNGALQSLLTGDPIALISAGVKTIISLFPQTAAEKYANQIERINAALKEQQRLIEQAKRDGNEAQRRKEEIELLKQKKAYDEAELAKAIKIKENALGWGDAYEEKKQKVKDLTAAVLEDKQAIEDAEQALNDFLSGGVTQATIADVIADGFQSGKTSVDDFADYMNDVLLDAVLQIFKAEILGEQINEMSDYIRKALDDKVLTVDEKAEIDKKAKEIADKNKPLWDALTGALDLPEQIKKDEQKGLTGSIQNITEETGGFLAGQIFASRELQQKQYMTGLEQLDAINQSVTHLAEIAKNTRHNARLEAIETGINSMNTILKERL